MATVKLTKLEYFEHGYAQLGMDFGLISPSSFEQFIHYKVYLDFRSAGYKKTKAIEMTSERCKSSDSTVWRSVDFFESDEVPDL